MAEKFEVIENFKCYAPELAFESRDYSPDFFEKMFALEENNFWFQARNRILRGLFEKFIGKNQTANILEIGVGTGYVLKELSSLKNFKLQGGELHISGLRFARKRLPEVEFIQLDATRMPFKNEFEAVGAFDVLEHVDEDLKIMQGVHRSLKAGGLFFITVPQHKFLWSKQDEGAYHKRRYSREEMLDKLKNSNFEIEFVSSFVTILFPLMFLSRWSVLKKHPPKNGIDYGSQDVEYDFDELKISPFVNTISGLLMRFDEICLKMGLSLPFGGSLAVVARKNS
jgi:SAM-dependent methyltransferase